MREKWEMTLVLTLETVGTRHEIASRVEIRRDGRKLSGDAELPMDVACSMVESLRLNAEKAEALILSANTKAEA